MEKNYTETSGDATIKLAMKALVEVVESGSKNMEARAAALGFLPLRPFQRRPP